MKKMIIKTSAYALFMGVLVFIQSNAQGQEGHYGTCNSDNNTAPIPDCISEPASISWLTGTSHCAAHVSASSECWDGTIINAIKHTEPVSWNDVEGDNWGTLDPETLEWVFQKYFPDPIPDCLVLQGIFEGTDPSGRQAEYQKFRCSDFTTGADTQTTASGPACSELDLL